MSAVSLLYYSPLSLPFLYLPPSPISTSPLSTFLPSFLSFYPPFSLSTCLTSSTYLPTHLPICNYLVIYLTYVPTYIPTYLTYLPTYLPIYLSIYLTYLPTFPHYLTIPTFTCMQVVPVETRAVWDELFASFSLFLKSFTSRGYRCRIPMDPQRKLFLQTVRVMTLFQIAVCPPRALRCDQKRMHTSKRPTNASIRLAYEEATAAAAAAAAALTATPKPKKKKNRRKEGKKKKATIESKWSKEDDEDVEDNEDADDISVVSRLFFFFFFFFYNFFFFIWKFGKPSLNFSGGGRGPM